MPIHLRWGDLDAYNHVNNAVLLQLLEEARVRIFWEPEHGEDAPETAVMESHATSGVMRLVARQEIEYLAPVPYGRDPLDLQLWFGRLGGASVDVCCEVFSPEGTEPRTLYVRATTVVVLVAEGTGRPVRLSDRERAVWTPYLGQPIEHRRAQAGAPGS